MLCSTISAKAQLLGIDLSISAIGLCSARLREYIPYRLRLVVGDICSDPAIVSFRPHVLTCIDVFSQLRVALIPKALELWNRALVDNGALVLNAYAPDDDTRQHCIASGEVINASRMEYSYKGTYYKYYEKEELRGLVLDAGFRIETIELLAWDDPPHGEYRPMEHRHSSHCLLARPK